MLTKEKLLKHLSTEDDYLVHDGKLLKRFTSIEIVQETKEQVITNHLGLFKKERIVEHPILRAKFFYFDELVSTKTVTNCDLQAGDKLVLSGLNGLIETKITED